MRIVGSKFIVRRRHSSLATNKRSCSLGIRRGSSAKEHKGPVGPKDAHVHTCVSEAFKGFRVNGKQRESGDNGEERVVEVKTEKREERIRMKV